MRGTKLSIVERPFTRRPTWVGAVFLAAVGIGLAACGDDPPTLTGPEDEISGALLDQKLAISLQIAGITGRIEESFTTRLGRPIDARLAEVGRLLFFDPVLSITRDNSCSGCHGPNVAFNDSKSIAVGVGNNGIVGPGREGPHNSRRAPTIINAAFYPKLMWESRFEARSLDPFDNSQGFSFPEPEGLTLSDMDHLLGAQAFTPVVSRVEMAGFEFQGDNDSIRATLERRVDAIADYRAFFGEVYPEIEAGSPITYRHIAEALAEFQFTLLRADAPIDEYARGDTSALGVEEKLGGVLFFNLRGACFECHITHGFSNEMFSDFDSHVLAVPQIVPLASNADFDGPGRNEDFGLERHTGNPDDRYKFRSSPLRNVAFQPSFMHNGAFVCLDDAIRHHTDMLGSLDRFDPQRLAVTLQGALGPTQPMVQRAHHLSATPRDLTDAEFAQLASFVRISLTDPDAHPDQLRHLIPSAVPSGLPVHDFDYSSPPPDCS